MSNDVPQDLRLLSCFNSQPLDTSVAFALLWLVSNESSLKLNERPILKKHLSTLSLGKKSITEIWKVVVKGVLQSFKTASEVLVHDLEKGGKEFFMIMAMEVAAEKGEIEQASNHVLRFYCDLLGFEQKELEEKLLKNCGYSLEKPADISSPEWWAAIDIKSDVENLNATSLTRSQALVILELDSSADSGEIKKAYRRLVQLHHPDRFNGASLAAQGSAQSRFILVRKAYEVLK